MAVEHYPVLYREVMAFFSPFPHAASICDATFGRGGHTALFLEHCGSCVITAVDADSQMIAAGKERFVGSPRVRFVHGWFDEVLSQESGFDRIILDLGISMVHLRQGERGFSLLENGPLDMRLDPNGGGETAADLVLRRTETELADLIFQYGEERYSRRIARAIVDARRQGIATTFDLRDVVWHAVPHSARHQRIHPATRTFQAFRIAVNDELQRLERVLPAAVRALNPGGYLGVISFHSLEDRIVKHRFRGFVHTPIQTTRGDAITVRVVTKRPVVPTEVERQENPPSRSAKLRIIERESEVSVGTFGKRSK
jgi:16S rRNA (cytosine1402-N4)-methyltransferase